MHWGRGVDLTSWGALGGLCGGVIVAHHAADASTLPGRVRVVRWRGAHIAASPLLFLSQRRMSHLSRRFTTSKSCLTQSCVAFLHLVLYIRGGARHTCARTLQPIYRRRILIWRSLGRQLIYRPQNPAARRTNWSSKHTYIFLIQSKCTRSKCRASFRRRFLLFLFMKNSQV